MYTSNTRVNHSPSHTLSSYSDEHIQLSLSYAVLYGVQR